MTPCKQHQDLEITPRIDRLTCLRFQADEEDDLLSAPVLPDLALWEFRGTESLHGEPAGLWVLEQRCAFLVGAVCCCKKHIPCQHSVHHHLLTWQLA